MDDSADIVVVGAGPAGSSVAHGLAVAGRDVLLLEEHATIGEPEHCCGIVSRELFDDFGVPTSLVRASLDRFRVYGPGGRSFDVPGGTPAAWSLDRRALDQWLVDRAVAAGARLRCGARVQGVTQDADAVTVTVRGGDSVRAGLCVLACGAMSNLPRDSGLATPRQFYQTVQATFEAPGVYAADVFLGRRLAPGSFGWAAACGSGLAKVGIICRGPAHGGWASLLEALSPRLGRPQVAPQYRRIPMGASRRTAHGRIVAVGDAAGQAKTTTGGGIYYAMLCARLLVEAIREGCLERYESAWRQRLLGEIQAGLWLRGFFESVGDDEVDALVTLAGTNRMRGLVEQSWSFDHHRRLLVAMLAAPEMRRQALGLAWRTLAAAGTPLALRGVRRVLRLAGGDQLSAAKTEKT
jgi:geranylgeranyl reductase family protein